METITIQTTVQLPAEKAWQIWTQPQHIIHWNFASDDWQCPTAESDLRPGGKFTSKMEAKDGSMGFDFGGTFNEVRPYEFISYTMDDNRKVSVSFTKTDNGTKITETFEAESVHSMEEQQAGWQTIMDNYKKYAESV